MEMIKAITDKLILWFLHTTSKFGKELTSKGFLEQKMWREQRWRNLTGLTIRSRQRLDATKKSTRQSE